MTSKGEKIVVEPTWCSQFRWFYVVCGRGVAESTFTFDTTKAALRSARRFAAKFKVPPRVVVEGEE